MKQGWVYERISCYIHVACPIGLCAVAPLRFKRGESEWKGEMASMRGLPPSSSPFSPTMHHGTENGRLLLFPFLTSDSLTRCPMSYVLSCLMKTADFFFSNPFFLFLEGVRRGKGNQDIIILKWNQRRTMQCLDSISFMCGVHLHDFFLWLTWEEYSFECVCVSFE